MRRATDDLKRSCLARACALAALPLLPLAQPGCATGGPTAPAGALPAGGSDDVFEEGARRAPTAETLYAMARIVAAQGRESVYEFVLKRIIEEHPRFLPAYSDLARLNLSQNRVDGAVETLGAGLRAGPKDQVLLNNLGMCHLLKGHPERALERFSEAAAIDPEATRYRANMAAALGMLGRYEESLSLYSQVVPEADAHHNLAVLCEARKDLARAAEEYRMAAELEPSFIFSRWWAEMRHAMGGWRQF
ncbi:MAG: hypothetical protein HY721_10995 [Planctomycetes bacterium]|nr:hypothetical protein [Planctomycetota bacterium]